MRNLSIIIISLSVSACLYSGSGPFGTHYVSSQSNHIQASLTKSADTPKIFSTNNIEKDFEKLQQNGYVLMGSSIFINQDTSLTYASNLAREVGATHILYSRTYSHERRSQNMQNTEPKVLAMNFGSSAPPLGKIDIGGIVSSSRTQNNYNNTYYQPSQNIRYYRFVSHFFVKSQNTFGLSFGGDNTNGIEILNVEHDSIAEKLGLKSSDIIVSVNGAKVTTVNNSTKDLPEFDNFANPVRLIVERNGKSSIYTIPSILKKKTQ